MSDYTKEFLAMSNAYEASGGNPASLSDGRIAGLLVSHRERGQEASRDVDGPGIDGRGIGGCRRPRDPPVTPWNPIAVPRDWRLS
jgi:hypothetical protein